MEFKLGAFPQVQKLLESLEQTGNSDWERVSEPDYDQEMRWKLDSKLPDFELVIPKVELHVVMKGNDTQVGWFLKVWDEEEYFSSSHIFYVLRYNDSHVREGHGGISHVMELSLRDSLKVQAYLAPVRW